MAHRLDVVAVGIADEGAEVGGVVLRPLPGSVQHLGPGGDGGVDEGRHRSPIGGQEGDVTLAEAVPGPWPQPEGGSRGDAEPDGRAGLGDPLAAERGQDRVVERGTGPDVVALDGEMVDHRPMIPSRCVEGVGGPGPWNRPGPRPVGPAMATRVVATAFGGPEVLAVVDEAVPDPGPGQVSVEVRSVGTNPIDYKQFSGQFDADPSRLPMPVGMEAAGVVTAVGAGAAGPGGPVRPGDEVILYRITGAYASQLVVAASAAVAKPARLSFEEAGGLMLTGVTAVHALAATAVGPGDTVVIHGASGGVGLMAVQLAVADGARVIGTASETGHAHLRQLGAEPVAYGHGLLDRLRDLAPGGVDAAIDTVGTDEAIDVSVALVADRDRIATLAAPRRGFELGLRVLGGAPGADPGIEVRQAARLELVRRAEAGTLSVLVAGTYPLAQAADALRRLAGGHTHGKIVLVP